MHEEPPRPVDSGRFSMREQTATTQPQKKERDAEKERLLDLKMKALRGGSIKVEKVQVAVQKKINDQPTGKQRDPEKERLLDEKMKAMKLKAAQPATTAKTAAKPSAAKYKPSAAKKGFRAIAAPKADPIPLRVHAITAKDEEDYRALSKETIAGYDKQITSLMKEMYEDRNAGMMILDDINSKIKHRSHYWQLAFSTMDIACEALRSQAGRAKEILRFLRCKTMDSRLMAKALNMFSETMDDKKVDFPNSPAYFKEMVQYAVSEGLVADIELSSEAVRRFGGLSPAGPVATALWSGKLGAELKAPSGADPNVFLAAVLDYTASKSLSVNDLVELEEEDSETYVFTAAKDDQYGTILKAVLLPITDADAQYALVKVIVAFAKRQGFPTIGDDDSLLQTLLYSFYDLDILEDMETALIKWFQEAKAEDAASTPVTQVNDFMESLMDDDDDDDDDSDDE